MSTISGMGAGSNSMMAQMMQRTNPAKMADSLYSKLDTTGKGYIEKSDLQSALNQISGSENSASADDIFKKLDGNSDGKVTKDEMTAGMEKLAASLNSQFNQMRVNGSLSGVQAGMPPPGGMPPPPPPGGGDKPDLTKEQLTSMSSELASTDSQRSNQMSNIAQNFEAADTNSDGKVSFQEAQSYDQADSSSSSSYSSVGEASNNSSSNTEARILKQMLDLLQAYGNSDSTLNGSNFSVVV